MKIYRLTCPACGADVEIETNRKSCFCSYCGTKVYVDDGTKRVEITKNITYHTIHTDEAKIKEIEANEKLQRLRYDIEKDRQKQKRKEKRRKMLMSFMGTVFGIICVIVYLGASSSYFASEKRASDLQEKALQEIVDEVLICIENDDFETARSKAQTIVYTENWSGEIEEKWDNTRKDLLKQIDSAEKEWKKENRNTDTWWNPFD